MSFLDDIKAFQEKAMQAASKNTNNIVEDLFTKAVVLSPVKPVANYAAGVLVNNWYSAVGNTPSMSVGSSANMNGVDSLSRIKATMAEMPFLSKDSTVTLANNLSYAYRADVLGWPKGDSENNWHWSGRVGPYLMTSGAINYTIGKYA